MTRESVGMENNYTTEEQPNLTLTQKSEAEGNNETN
jgi:hypothetical protein